jgi:ABC-type transporter Mla maintaining outer membrane lipid asymmetry ATPase subunit MlaF
VVEPVETTSGLDRRARKRLDHREIDHRCSLLALDEPAAGLDPASSDKLYRLLAHINREAGLSIIMVSHDIDNIKKYAHSIINLENGRIIT